MNCSKCQTQNENDARFCKNCGANLNLHYVVRSKPNNQDSDPLLITFIAIVVICSLANFMIPKFVMNWYESPAKYIQTGFWILQNLSFILPALAIKDKTSKPICIAVISVCVLYWICSNILFALR